MRKLKTKIKHKNTLIGLLFLLLILSNCIFAHVYHQQQRIIEEQSDIIARLTHERALTRIPPSSGVGCANIVAVRSNTNTGVMGKVYVKIKEGSGSVLINTNPFVEPTTQHSVREAVEVAEHYTSMNLSGKDVIIYFDINGSVIGGPSAGAAITTAVIAALEGKEVRQDAVITGSIEEGGYIGHVAAIFEKAIAAECSGMRLFLVPQGQKKLTYYERRTKEHHLFGFSFSTTYYEPKEIDLGEYMKGKMTVEEVSKIEDVLSYLIR